MKALKRFPIYTFLLAVFFCLHIPAQNPGTITTGDAFFTGMVILFFITVFFLLFYFASGRKLLYTGAVIFFAGTWYLFFGAIKNAVQTLPFVRSYLVIIPLLIGATIAWAVIIRKKEKSLPDLTFFLNLLLIIYCVFDTGSILFHFSSTNGKSSPADDFVYAAVKEKPDVYFLLFDGYAGYNSLRDSFGFENSFLRDSLDRQGFEAVPSSANYFITPISMCSIFNMSYEPEETPGLVRMSDIRRAISKVDNAAVFQIFEKMGYQISNYSIFDAAGQRALGGGVYFPSHERLLTYPIFHNRFFKDVAPRLAEAKLSNKFVKRILLGDLPEYNARVEGKLYTQISSRPSAPQFVYSHFLMPHYPYFFDSSGRDIPDSIVLKERIRSGDSRSLYISYLKYCNKKIVQYSTDITAKHPGAVIIIMSDHGFRSYNKRNFEPAYLDNICEVRIPGKHAFPVKETLAAVNFFRHFFNVCFNQHYPLLKVDGRLIEDAFNKTIWKGDKTF